MDVDIQEDKEKLQMQIQELKEKKKEMQETLKKALALDAFGDAVRLSWMD
jgi:hypothetical protein